MKEGGASPWWAGGREREKKKREKHVGEMNDTIFMWSSRLEEFCNEQRVGFRPRGAIKG